MAGVEIVVNQPTEKILLPIHPVRLHQLLINLVSNAIDACIAQTAASGETPGKDREHKVTISALKNGSHIELSVADTGCGISAEHQARLFKDQFTTKNGGSGIGLMTIKSVVNGDLGGTIEVKSKEGKGAEFVVRI
jgi:C4-dicarboxylate-specific signal transduction histidine kinase